jgi:tungstate transport system ATP-binding protein
MAEHHGTALLPLRFVDVTYIASGRTILDRVSVTVHAGARTVIMGPNGAGKSVFMRLAHGLLAPTQGRVEWNASDRSRAPRRQAMVFQRPVMFRRSALANVALGLALAGVPRHERKARAHEALARVGLDHLAGRSARVLSGGEQQRVALARAWAMAPEVLFLDEPTANLDPAATREVERIVQDFHEAGTKIVLVTHDVGQARRLADEVLFLDRGRAVEHAAAAAFFRAPASSAAAQFVRGELPPD